MKWVIRLVVSALLGVGVLFGVLMVPSVQKKLALSILQSRYSDFSIKDIHVYLSHVKLGGVHFTENGTKIGVGSLDLRWSPIPFLLRQQVKIESLVVSDVIVDCSNDFSSGVKVAQLVPELHSMSASVLPKREFCTSDFRGFLKYCSLPMLLQVKKLNIDAMALLPENKKVLLSIDAKNIFPEKPSSLNIRGRALDLRKNAPIESICFNNVVEFTQTSSAHIDKLQVTGDFQAFGPEAKHAPELKIELSLQKKEPGEVFFANVFADKNMEESLLQITGSYDKKSRFAKGRVVAHVSCSQIQPFVLFNLPSFNLQLQALISANVALCNGAAVLESKIQAKQLGNLVPELAALDSAELRSSIDFLFSKQNIEVKSLRVNALDDKENSLLTMGLLSPFKFDLKTMKVAVAPDVRDLLKIGIPSFPVEYLSAIASSYGYLVEGENINGEILLSCNEDKSLYLATPTPLTFDNLTVSSGKKKWIKNVTITVDPSISVLDEMVRYKISTKISTRSKPLLSLQHTGSIKHKNYKPEVIEDEGIFSASLNTLSRQPIANGYVKQINDPLQFVAHYDVNVVPDKEAVVKAITMKLEKSDTTVLSLKSSEAISIDLVKKGETGLLPKVDLALSMSAFPMDPLSCCMKGSHVSGILTGDFKIQSDGEMIAVRPNKLLVMKGISFSKGREIFLKNVGIVCSPSVLYAPDCIQASVQSLQVEGGQSPILSGSIVASIAPNATLNPLQKAAINIFCNINSLLQQPFFTGDKNITGSIHFEANANSEKSNKFLGKLVLEASHAENPSQSIFISAPIEGAFLKDNQIKLRVPLKIQGSDGTSDLTFEGSLTKEAHGFGFDASIGSTRFNIDDVMGLSAILQHKDTNAAPPKVTTSSKGVSLVEKPKDTAPFWQGTLGQATIDAKSVLFNKKMLLKDAQAKLNISENKVDLTSLKALIYGAPLSCKGGIGFQQKAPQPYSMDAQLRLENLNVGLLLSEFNGGTTPINGSFTTQADIKSQGINLESLENNIQGNASVSSKKGTITPFSVSKKAQVGTALLSIAGTALGAATNSAIGNVGSFAGSAIAYFQEIKYDQILIQAKRDKSYDIEISQILLQNPELFVSGKGTVKFVSNVKIPDQPLSATVRIDALGQAAQVFDKIGLISPTKTDQGYYKGQTFAINGTLSKPDYSSVTDAIMRPQPTQVKQQTPPRSHDESLTGALRSLFGR
ncbi:MAG: hypothetical protein A2007_05160 [Verrucomicrobia bacterium GWC2_42_7]|nr:MAG: hypothetical protein A2007_05160 [Verrucomicrobia bacterium GWC2_42_7]